MAPPGDALACVGAAVVLLSVAAGYDVSGTGEYAPDDGTDADDGAAAVDDEYGWVGYVTGADVGTGRAACGCMRWEPSGLRPISRSSAIAKSVIRSDMAWP